MKNENTIFSPSLSILLIDDKQNVVIFLEENYL